MGTLFLPHHVPNNASLTLPVGTTSKSVARTMLSYHPYNTWPLHVKIFTEEAEKIWEDVSKAADAKFPLPRGFTYCIEYEGVDGKSGKTNTGRIGPINVSDGTKLVIFGDDPSLCSKLHPSRPVHYGASDQVADPTSECGKWPGMLCLP